VREGRRWSREERSAPPQNPGATVSRALGYLSPYLPTTFIIAVCLIAVAALGSVPPLLIREIIDTALPDGNRGLLNLLAVSMVVVPLGSGLVNVLQNHLNASVSQRIMFDIRNQLYNHLQGLSLRFFTSSRTGEIMSRVTDDVAAIQNTVTGSLISIASNFFTIAITLAVIFTLNWQLALIGISLLPLFIIPTRIVGNLRRSLQRRTQWARAELNTHMQETLNVSGFLLMKVFNRERYEADRFQGRSREVMDLQVHQALVGRWFFMLMGLFSFIGPALIYWWGGQQVINGTLTIGTIVAFVAYLARLYGPVSSLATVYVDVQAALALFERIFEYLDVESEITDPPDGARLPRLNGRIQFDNVSFEYVPGRPALKDLSFTIEPGQLAALVGPTGAGKTTVTYLLPRLYDPTTGSILLEGHDLRAVSLDSLRSQMGVVTQETFLFNTTIRENLMYGRSDATDDELAEACKAAQLQEFIADLPDGYETVVGERGYRLSGGEKQRLAIARVILKDPAVLILDEATAHLDSLSERLIRTALEPLLKRCTSVVVAHRLSTILRADTILVMDKGRLVEQGTHAQLLVGSGLYTRIYEEQFRSQEDAEPLALPNPAGDQ
jgi:ATP-binding cassette subfamily B protein